MFFSKKLAAITLGALLLMPAAMAQAATISLTYGSLNIAKSFTWYDGASQSASPGALVTGVEYNFSHSSSPGPVVTQVCRNTTCVNTPGGTSGTISAFNGNSTIANWSMRFRVNAGGTIINVSVPLHHINISY